MGLFFNLILDSRAYAQKSNAKEEIDSAALDPLNKIGQGITNDANFNISCRTLKITQAGNTANPKISAMLSGYPMAKMIPSLGKRKGEVALYLVAIAKKESDWGKHSPKKSGKECYNYWGYRGGYNETQSGYSCFDSPEQAVRVVGDRIEKLLGQRLNTPEKMIVWKCGSTCAGHDPAGVRKWISDVSLYYKKLNS